MAPGHPAGLTGGRGYFKDSATHLAHTVGDRKMFLATINLELQDEAHCRIASHVGIKSLRTIESFRLEKNFNTVESNLHLCRRISTSCLGRCRLRMSPRITCGELVASRDTSLRRPVHNCPIVAQHHQAWASTCGTSCHGVRGPGCQRGVPPTLSCDYNSGELRAGKGFFCPLFILAPTSLGSRLAPSRDQHCPSPPEPCPGPRRSPRRRHLLLAVASCSSKSPASPLWPGSAAFPGSRYSISRPPPRSLGFVKAHFPIRG